jgi:GAF domain-containing protein
MSQLDADPAGVELLVEVIHELSLVRDLASIMMIVRRAARALTGADGATFVLREGDHCFYADEDAIAPLWKGKRFAMSECISGWTMLHSTPVVLEDVFADPRVPAAAYRTTFVKSLVIVPIRRVQPIGAIGAYWTLHHKPRADHVWLLQALAASTSTAMRHLDALARSADGSVSA